MILVLSVFIAILFDHSHTPNFWISKFTKFISSSKEELTQSCHQQKEK